MKSINFFSVLIIFLTLASCQTNTDQSSVASTEEATAITKTVANKETPKALGVKVGDEAPAFELTGVDDKTYSFDNILDANQQAPKGYIVTFTCNTCPYAVGYEDRLIAMHNKLSPMGYPIVAIQANDPEVKPGDSFEEMKKRHSSKSFPFIYLMDEGQKVYPQYGASKTPEIYVVDNNRIVRYHGAIDDNAQHPESVSINYVENAIMAIEAGHDPDPADVKAIGCTIKTK